MCYSSSVEGQTTVVFYMVDSLGCMDTIARLLLVLNASLRVDNIVHSFGCVATIAPTWICVFNVPYVEELRIGLGGRRRPPPSRGGSARFTSPCDRKTQLGDTDIKNSNPDMSSNSAEATGGSQSHNLPRVCPIIHRPDGGGRTEAITPKQSDVTAPRAVESVRLVTVSRVNTEYFLSTKTITTYVYVFLKKHRVLMR